MQKNYLPFIRRQRLTVPATAAVNSVHFSSIPQLATEGGVRAHLTDAYVFGAGATFNMRMGLTTQSYFTEQFYPSSMFHDGVMHETGCWRFAKPYRIFPGDRLRVQVVAPGNRNDLVGSPAVIFSGIRLDTNEPILLYDMQDSTDLTPNGTFLFNRETLRCPAETPIDLYSVTVAPPSELLDIRTDTITQPNGVAVMIWGPDGRQWWDSAAWTQLFTINSHVIDLRKVEFELLPEETMVFEFLKIAASQSDVDLWITVRGSYEVIL
jgi:hypothetical protein